MKPYETMLKLSQNHSEHIPKTNFKTKLKHIETRQKSQLKTKQIPSKKKLKLYQVSKVNLNEFQIFFHQIFFRQMLCYE